MLAQRRARPQFVEDRERRDFPHRRVRPRSVEVQLILSIDDAQIVGRKLELGQPADEVRREHPFASIEAVARQPDQLLFREPDRSRMVELGAQFALVDDLREADARGAVDDRECRVDVRMQLADHLEHQQFVEIGIEQAAHDRVEPPAVIVGACRDVGQDHAPLLPASRGNVYSGCITGCARRGRTCGLATAGDHASFRGKHASPERGSRPRHASQHFERTRFTGARERRVEPIEQHAIEQQIERGVIVADMVDRPRLGNGDDRIVA